MIIIIIIIIIYLKGVLASWNTMDTMSLPMCLLRCSCWASVSEKGSSVATWYMISLPGYDINIIINIIIFNIITAVLGVDALPAGLAELRVEAAPVALVRGEADSVAQHLQEGVQGRGVPAVTEQGLLRRLAHLAVISNS